MTAGSHRRLVSVLLGLLALAGAPAGWLAAQAPPAFDSTRAYAHVREQVNFGPRPAGSPANQKTRDYIVKVLGESGYKAVEQTFEPGSVRFRVIEPQPSADLIYRQRPALWFGAEHLDDAAAVKACRVLISLRRPGSGNAIRRPLLADERRCRGHSAGTP